VLQQQGRVSLDADANEQCAINDYLRTTETVDVVGAAGGPVNDEGFEISVVGESIRIGKGRYYVEGILCENNEPLLYAGQRYLINPSPDGPEMLASLRQGSIKVIQLYLEVWQRLVTALDDPCLREPALGMADTTCRLQTVWRVVAKPLTSLPTASLAGTVALTTGSPAVTGTRTAFTTSLEVGQQLVFAADSTQTPYVIQNIASDTSLTLTSNYAGASTASTRASVVEPVTACCKSMQTGRVPTPGSGELYALTSSGSGDCTCQPTPAAGYRGVENQLYRVEIHQHGDETSATFKWSRENGSVVAAITSVSGNTVYVDSLGPDANLGFSPQQWVEIYDDTNLFGQPPNQPGNLYQIKSISPETLSLTTYQTVTLLDPTRNPRMRRWDQSGTSAGTNGVPVSSGPIDLENGIQVEFSKGEYRSGDYWLIPARTAIGNIEWPPCNSNGQPPQRTEIFVAPLACIEWNSQKEKPHVQDCRTPFYPLTELRPTKAMTTCCTYRVGDGVKSFGDYTSIQAAVNALPAEGGEICILPGIYYEHVRIVNRRDVVIHGCGGPTRVASPSLAVYDPLVPRAQMVVDTAGATNPFTAVFSIVASAHIKLRSFAVEAADGDAGVLIDGTGTSLSTNQSAELAPALTRLQGVTDVTIEDMVFTASTRPAILAEYAQLLRIDRNRVAMKNVESLWPAIYASGTEIHIDENWVGIQSAATIPEWLPYSVSEDLSGATSSGTARTATFNPASTVTRGFVDASGLNLISVEVAVHPGGIQIGGPSTDVYILENEIEGGSRNGITLGSFQVLDTKGTDTRLWIGTSFTTETETCECNATLQAPGNYPGKPGYTVVAGGLLTNIQIHRNRIRDMGICGIGPVGFFDLRQTLEVISIVGLNILSNAISRTVLRSLTPPGGGALEAYGAICVPDVQNLVVRDNTIADFGAQPGANVCGIFVLHGEMIEISRNQVLETRDWAGTTESREIAATLWHGGIVICIATPPSFTQPLDASLWGYTQLDNAGATNAISTPIYEPGLPALRVEHNLVRVPVCYALEAFGWGPFAIVNNHLGCGGLVRTTRFEAAQTVLIFNLGSAIETTTAASKPSNVFFNANATAGAVGAGSFQNVSCGAVLFSNNLCQLEATASEQHEYSSVAIFTADHLIFSNNHCWLDTSRRSALTDALLVAGSLNVVGNRFQESPLSVYFSAITAGVTNITSLNVATFCLFVLGVGTLRVDVNNVSFLQGVDREICGKWEKGLIAALKA
jgi:hypothetical protein